MKSLMSFSHLITLSLPLFLLLSSCSTQNDNTSSDNGLPTIHVDIDASPAPFKSSEILKDARIIPLETNDSCLILKIQSIKRVNDRLYVSDATDAIYTFDLDGHFISSLKKKGNGPGEYISMGDFDVDKNGNIYVFCYHSRRIYIYDRDGSFKENIDVKDFPSEIFISGDGSILAYVGYGKKSVSGKRIVAINNPSTGGYLSADTLVSQWATMIHVGKIFTRQGDSVIVSEQYNDTIYSIETKGIKPYALIDFGGRSIHADMLHLNKDYSNFWNDFIDNGCVFRNGGFMEGNSFCCVSYTSLENAERGGIGMLSHNSIINKQTGDCKTLSNLYEDKCLFGMKIGFGPILDLSTFATPLAIEFILEHAVSLPSADRDSLLRRVNYQDDDQNPVLFVGTLK